MNIGNPFALALLLLIGFTSISFAQEEGTRTQGYERGRLEAVKDTKKQIYIIKVWGRPDSSVNGLPTQQDIYERILKKKYRVQLEWIGGCVIDFETEGYGDGYNEVSTRAIEVRYGKGILDKVQKQAGVEYERRFAENEPESAKRPVAAAKSLSKKDNK